MSYRTKLIAIIAVLFGIITMLPSVTMAQTPDDTFPTQVPCEEGERPCPLPLECTASVTILEAEQTSPGNIRVIFEWLTTGATSLTAHVSLVPVGSSVPVYESGQFNLSPVSTGESAFLVTGPFQTGSYTVAVIINTDCGHSDRDDAPVDFVNISPTCAASVNINEAVQTSPNVRVSFEWDTLGATTIEARVQLFPIGSSTAVYDSGQFSVSPAAAGTAHLIVPGPFPTDTYKVRVRIITDCIASAQDETLFEYQAPPLEPIIDCASGAFDTAFYGEQCVSLIPNASGGYDVNYYALTDADPLAQNNPSFWFGVTCTTTKNGTVVENYAVENPLGTQQGSYVEFGVFGGTYSETGASSSGTNLPGSVPNDGATYVRTCFHWANFNFIQTTTTVVLP